MNEIDTTNKASTIKCQYCGATITSKDQSCPNCSAPNELYVYDSPLVIDNPTTIKELQEYCAERNMPLLRMRFFIGENYKEPKAFGIYEKDGQFIVYKNKANGERSIRYNGPDEKHAVYELYQKLLDECHNRSIYPEKMLPTSKKSKSSNEFNNRKKLTINTIKEDLIYPDYSTVVYNSSEEQYYVQKPKVKYKRIQGIKQGCFLALIFLLIGIIIFNIFFKTKPGYYIYNNTYYYYNNSDWYFYNNDVKYWTKTDPSDEVFDNMSYQDNSYNSSWDATRFYNEYESLSDKLDSFSHSSSNSSTDWDSDWGGSDSDSSWDSWDSSDTDWDSDW